MPVLRDPLEVGDDRLGVDLLLDVDRHRGDGQRLAVLLVLAAPDQLRVEVGVAGIHLGVLVRIVLAGVGRRRGRRLVLAHQRLQLGGRDVRALGLIVGEGLDAGARLSWSGLRNPTQSGQ